MNNNPKSQHRPWKVWQTSLRSLLLGAIATGTLAGLFGPEMMRVLRSRWYRPSVVPPRPVPIGMQVRGEEESNGYFESAETPLR